MAVMLPANLTPRVLSVEAGPTAVQALDDSGLAWSMVKMRKLTVDRSATASPSPLPTTAFNKVSDQLLSRRVPAVPLRSLTSRIQGFGPTERMLFRAAVSDSRGANRP